MNLCAIAKNVVVTHFIHTSCIRYKAIMLSSGIRLSQFLHSKCSGDAPAFLGLCREISATPYISVIRSSPCSQFLVLIHVLHHVTVRLVLTWEIPYPTPSSSSISLSCDRSIASSIVLERDCPGKVNLFCSPFVVRIFQNFTIPSERASCFLISDRVVTNSFGAYKARRVPLCSWDHSCCVMWLCAAIMFRTNDSYLNSILSKWVIYGFPRGKQQGGLTGL
jgi:hypothetical protein